MPQISQKKATLKLAKALKLMSEYFSKYQKEAKYLVMPGVFSLLKKLKKNGFLIAIMTGNIEKIAWLKLKNAKIKQFFDFGVFGNMALVREELIPIILNRVNKLSKNKVSPDDLIIVGDSLRDVSCAKSTGCHSIAIHSSEYSKKQLKKAGADLVVNSLNESKKILAICYTNQYEALQYFNQKNRAI